MEETPFAKDCNAVYATQHSTMRKYKVPVLIIKKVFGDDRVLYGTLYIYHTNHSSRACSLSPLLIHVRICFFIYLLTNC